ncbi:MAG TPA: tRNA threonylcarbamoyladenosine dehydratase [Clostridiales bacterium]|nr:tRNA threonylcarbamoyladenosine dehydratase [Clostridiales bacterium]
MQHAFSRFEMLLGPEALGKLAGSRVAVFGAGGVGSFVIEGLVRGGVGKFILVDDDYICLTNLNRQIHATRKTIGKPKVEVMKERILDINPGAEVEIHQLFYLPETAGGLLEGRIDYIVDAVDTVAAKLDIVVRAKEKGIPVISSMGMGNKLDPSRIVITDISKTTTDPLARVMRRELRARGITSLKVVFSDEVPAEPLKTDQSNGDDCCTCPKCSGVKPETKKRIPGSTSFVPPVAGLMIAGEVIRDLAGIKPGK